MLPERSQEAASVATRQVVGTTQEEVAQRAPVSVFRAVKLLVSGSQQLCLVRRISSRSVTAETALHLEEGDRISVELGGEWIASTVAVSEGNRAELAFEAPVAIGEWLAGPTGTQRRIMPRVEVDCRARLQLEGDSIFVSVRDISQEGTCVESDELLLEGDVVLVMLRGWGAPVRASVRWSDGILAGLSFHEALKLPQLMQWLASTPRRAGTADAIRSLSRQ